MASSQSSLREAERLLNPNIKVPLDRQLGMKENSRRCKLYKKLGLDVSNICRMALMNEARKILKERQAQRT